MGLRAVSLGHGYRPVVEAAYRQMLLGINFTRPATIELDCAQELLGLIDGANMVKFAKNGSDATSAAVRRSRADTGRNLIAPCTHHPIFSTDDWFIGSSPMSAGIPKVVQGLTGPFPYTDIHT